LLGIGFAFLLAVFPFHSWIPLLFEKARPYTASYVSIFLVLVVTLFALELFNRFAWLRNSELLSTVLRIGGLLMVLLGGLWIAYTSHLGRALGFAVVVVIGLALLTLSVTIVTGPDLYLSLMRTAALAVLIWSAALTFLEKQTGSLNLIQLRGAGRSSPLVAAGLVLSCLTLAGFPILAGYSVFLELFRALGTVSLIASISMVVGLTGLFAHGVRLLWTLASLNDGADGDGLQPASTGLLSWPQQALLLLGISLMLLIGML
jgi:NADH-quinone oxidoreductase subunit N